MGKAASSPAPWDCPRFPGAHPVPGREPRTRCRRRLLSLSGNTMSRYRRYLLCNIYPGFPCLALLTVQLRRKYCQEGQKQGWFICQSRRLFLFSNFVLSWFILSGTKEQNATSLRWGAHPHLTVYREHTKTEGETSSCRGWSALVGQCSRKGSETRQQQETKEGA